MNLKIRPMQAADIEAVIDLQWALNLFENNISGDRPVDRPAAHECVETNLRNIRQYGGAVLIAEDDTGIVGALSLMFADGPVYVRADLRRHGYVQDIVVAQQARGKGIAQALLARAEELTRNEGLSTLALSMLAGNSVAENAYRRFGFQPHSIEMAKKLI